MPKYSYLVLTSAVAGREDDYDQWSETRHLDDVLAVPGFVSARRFRVAVPQPGGPPRWQYVVLYELEAESVEASFEELSRRVGGELMPMSDSLDRGATATLLLEQLSHHAQNKGDGR